MIRFSSIAVLLLILSVGFPISYASHGGGSGGGGGGSCGGECIPPTLGVDRDGKVRVQDGLMINSMSFDVDLYSQNVPTQVLNKDEQATVILKIFDNDGPETLTHVELHLAPYDEFVSGVLVEKSVATLVWDGRDGDEVIGIYDDENILQNVAIDAKNENGFNIIVFTFEPVATIEKTSLLTILWDENRNVVKNYFVDAIKIIDPNTAPTSEGGIYGNAIPAWIKTSAGWWADEKISDVEFLGGIEFMIQTDILSFETTDSEKTVHENGEIPYWIKNTAKWWSADLIPEDDFVRGIQFLINNGMISL